MAQFSQRQIIQTLKQEAKQVLRENGISTSGRRANKELAFTLKRLAQKPYSSFDEVSKAGQELGQEIVKLSQERNKQSLDGGVLRLMSPAALASGVPSAAAGKAKSSQATTPSEAAEPKSEPAPESGPATPASGTTASDNLAADNEPESPQVVADVEGAEDAQPEAQAEAEAQSETLVDPEEPAAAAEEK